MSNIPGGFGETKDADEEIQKLCDQVKAQVEEKTRGDYEVFTAVQYREQVVAGMNYIIKVDVGGSSYLHIKVFKNLSGEIMLSSLEEDHSKDDPIEPF
ncbi:cystatin-A-like [Cheilinus undulatus]|uniref:cystatin-A-like n=1 Tax=Cheilinus undulatus TaxID=241271 RepID=UPI001BD244BC|nr:cystatin-A-like [Cheilinus undulatus]